MSTHYQLQHICGHIGIGPLILTHSPLRENDNQSLSSNQISESINLSLPIRCPFCANTQPFLNVAAGDGLLAILEQSTALSPTSSAYIPIPHSSSSSSSFEWRVLRVCPASEITSSDWYLAHAPREHFRQMAWIPKPCGTVKIDGSDGAEDLRGSSGVMRQFDCSWRQAWQRSDLSEGGVKSRLPGMWSNLKAILISVEDHGENGT
jgi:hypothetical protein